MRRSWRLPVALVTAVVVAEAAVLVMRPRDRGPEPVPVEPRAYFSEAQIEKAEAFRTGQLWIYVAQTAIGLGVLVLIVRRPPERLAALRRPVLAGAAVAAAISVATGVAALPLSAVARERAKDVGLVTQDWVGYAGDVAKSQAIGAGFAALGGAVLVFGMRRFGRRWWLPGAAVVVAFGALTAYAGPVVLDPLFNDFKRLPRGELRTDVLELARKAGVDVGEVYEMDASRRTTAANAYVTGLRQDQAGRALRHADRGLRAGRDAPRRRARARARAPPRRPRRADLAGDRRAVRRLGRGAAGGAAGAARAARSGRARCPPWRSRSRSSCRS